MKIANHYLTRTATISYNKLKCLEFRVISEGIQELNNYLNKLQQLKKNICDYIYTNLHSITCQSFRNDLLQLRRDIYNDRAIKIQIFEKHENLKDMEMVKYLITKINSYIDVYNQTKQLSNSLEDSFKTELANKRKLFQVYITQSEFSNGIYLSNSHLASRYFDYLNRSNISNPKKTHRQTESVLMNYFHRSTIKTSPFASFVGIGYGFITPCTNQLTAINQKISFVKINRSFLFTIARKLAQHPEIYCHLTPRINNTIIRKGNHIKYFKRGEDGTWDAFHKESIINLTVNVNITNILKLCTGDLQIRDIVKTTTVDNAIKLLKKMQDIQLILVDFSIPDEEENYMTCLIAKLKEINSNIVDKIIPHLDKLNKTELMLSNASVKQKIKLIDEIKATFSEIENILNISLLKFTDNNNLIYEDMINQNQSMTEFPKFESIEDQNDQLSKFIAVYDETYLQRMLFSALFESKYGKNGSCDNILDFYSFYRQFNQIERYAYINANCSQRVSELTKKIQNTRARIANDMLQSTHKTYKISDNIHKLIDTTIEAPPYDSLSLFVLINKKSDAIEYVIDRIGCGFGKYFSRFLYLLNNQQLNNSITTYASKQSDDSNIICDLQANLGLNVNHHPNTLGHDLIYPGCVSALDDNKVIKLSEISVRHDSDSNSLILWSNKLNKKINLIQHGFLFPRLGPKLYEFLCWFTPPGNFDLSLAEYVDLKTVNKIKYLPRIQFNNLILSRAAWIINKDYLPKIDSGDSQFRQFTKILNWLNDNELPHEFFMRNVTAKFSGKLPQENINDWLSWFQNNKKRKPQYMNMLNHLNISNYRKVIANASEHVLIEELLPIPLIENIEKPSYATEYVVELYK